MNSFPKSGTHLLAQAVEALPVDDYGSFVASTPSITLKPRSIASTLKLLRQIAPGELVRAHLWYECSYDDALAGLNTVNLFIYRDLRDVVLSEMHYLTEMAPWHRLHGVFRSLPTQSARLLLAIRGLEGEGSRMYPDVAQRFARYKPWLDNPEVTAVRFEDLTAAGRRAEFGRIAEAYASRSRPSGAGPSAALAMVSSIDPGRSHTFRNGKRGAWANEFDPEHVEAMKEVAGDLLVALGYASDLDWDTTRACA